MEELIRAGYVYIAKPPLYKLKQGSKERYVEKEAELEEILLSDKWEKFDIRDRDGERFKLTEQRWQRFGRLLNQYEGWSSALRGSYGHDLVGLVEQTGLLASGADTLAVARKLLSAKHDPTAVHSTEVLESGQDELVVRIIETATGFARVQRLRKRCSPRTTTRNCCACTAN